SERVRREVVQQLRLLEHALDVLPDVPLRAGPVRRDEHPGRHRTPAARHRQGSACDMVPKRTMARREVGFAPFVWEIVGLLVEERAMPVHSNAFEALYIPANDTPWFPYGESGCEVQLIRADP